MSTQEGIKIQNFQAKLLCWFAKNKRDFPWRHTSNPYHVLLAEFLLQQTNVRKVPAVYNELLERYPSVKDLAEASEAELRETVGKLGLSYRAERLKKTAQRAVDLYHGTIPGAKEELLKLPGVGEYIANAVLCFAFGRETPLVDTNIVRILRRVFGVNSSRPRPRTDKELWAKTASLIPKGKAREFNLALLDFAALVCTHYNPKCSTCPVKDLCIHWSRNKE